MGASVVAILLRPPTRERMHHGPVAGRAEQQTFEKGTVAIPHCGAARAAVPMEQLLNPAKDIGRDDCWMLPVMEFRLVFDFARVDGVGQEVVHAAPVERPSALGQPLLRLPRLVAPAPVGQLVHHGQQRFPTAGRGRRSARTRTASSVLTTSFGLQFDRSTS